MSPVLRRIVRWLPRLVGAAMALFLSLFALDAFAAPSILASLAGFAVHLVPAATVGLTVAVAWRHPWFGAAAFILLAAAYAVMARTHADWILAISGPLVAIGLLFAASAVVRSGERRSAAVPDQ